VPSKVHHPERKGASPTTRHIKSINNISLQNHNSSSLPTCLTKRNNSPLIYLEDIGTWEYLQRSTIPRACHERHTSFAVCVPFNARKCAENCSAAKISRCLCNETEPANGPRGPDNSAFNRFVDSRQSSVTSYPATICNISICYAAGMVLIRLVEVSGGGDDLYGAIFEMELHICNLFVWLTSTSNTMA